MNRRNLLATLGAAAALPLAARAAEPVRYPRLFSIPNMFWAEGPAWSGWGNFLVWSDIPNDLQYRWLDEDGHVSVYRKPANNSNGNTFDLEGRQISFEHLTHRVVRYEPDGSVTVLAESYGGKPLNAPNDGIVHPNGDLWFSDPGYGTLSNYEGRKANTGSVQPHQKEAIYRVDMKTGELHQVTDEIFKPNGVCFSPDYSILYAADTGMSHYPEAPPVIKAWDVVDEKRLANERTFASMAKSGAAAPTASAAMRKGTSGRAPAGPARATTASTYSILKAPAWDRSCCRRSAPTCVSAAASETACS